MLKYSVVESINVFNNSGVCNKDESLLLSEYRYNFRVDTGVFEACVPFTSSLPAITVKLTPFDVDTTDFEKIKTYLYTKGPLLAYFNGKDI